MVLNLQIEASNRMTYKEAKSSWCDFDDISNKIGAGSRIHTLHIICVDHVFLLSMVTHFGKGKK